MTTVVVATSPAPAAPAAPVAVAPARPAIVVTFPGGKRVDAQVGAFTIATDQPAAAGGADSAPAPFDLFRASTRSGSARPAACPPRACASSKR